MLNDLFKGSLALAAAGFLVVSLTSPETPRSKVEKMMERVSSLSAKQITDTAKTAHFAAARKSYELTLVNMQDYYDTVPNYRMIYLR